MLGGQEMSWGIVKSARSLGGSELGPEKRELEVQLPEGSTYRTGMPFKPSCMKAMLTATGDYLVVLPYNHQDTVRRVLAKFHLHPDDRISISGTRKSFLVNIPATPLSLH